MGNITDWNISRISYYISLLLTALYILCFPAHAYAQSDEEMKVLQMYFKEEELVVTSTRAPKPISQIAENISVITAKDIKSINAHTLTDILNTIPGVQMDIRGGPGSETRALIHGSEYNHVLVMIDGIILNNLSENAADISAIPIQNIERIEIVKGPASSSWGSSLGGVINIITKSPDYSRDIGGMFSASLGEQMTGDSRFELSGSKNDFGYYIYAGNLSSNGLRPSTNLDENNLYTKLTWDITGNTNAALTYGYNKGSRGRGEVPAFDVKSTNDFEYYFSSLTMNHSINNETDMSASLRTSKKRTDLFLNQLSTGSELSFNSFDDEGKGGSIKLLWKHALHNIVAGADYDDNELVSNVIKDGKQRLTKEAVFINDTIIMQEVSFTPGIRYDHTNTNADFLSPSVGIAYKPEEKTVLRGYVARGFNIPLLSRTYGENVPESVPNPDLEVEKVWSYQTGIESSALKYLWLKMTLFRHDISDAIDREVMDDGISVIAVNKNKQRRQGFELEIKTIPVYNTSLSAGYVYVDAKDRETDEIIRGIPRHIYDIGAHYNNNKSLSVSLKGHYIWWNAETYENGNYSNFIWDLNLTTKTQINDKTDIELFFTAHNIFNSSQYLFEMFKNPRRWMEGGVRLNF